MDETFMIHFDEYVTDQSVIGKYERGSKCSLRNPLIICFHFNFNQIVTTKSKDKSPANILDIFLHEMY